jgi:hypothetical protein
VTTVLRQCNIGCYDDATVPLQKCYSIEVRNLLQTIAPVNGLPDGPWRGRRRCFAPSSGVSITTTVRGVGDFPTDAAILVGRG